MLEEVPNLVLNNKNFSCTYYQNSEKGGSMTQSRDLDIGTLNVDQRNALTTFQDWWSSLHSSQGQVEQFFKLGGLAGTGKTYLLQYILGALGPVETSLPGPLQGSLIDEEKDGILWGAYTGKAALVMNRKGIPATTIHRMLYQVDEEKLKKGELVFTKRDALPEGTRLVVIDEASMVTEEIHNDLLSMNVPILYVGDYFQLPPVEGTFNLMLEEGLNARLQQIQRQALDSPIIKWSMWAREGRRLPMTNDRSTVLHSYYDDIPTSSLLAADQIIVGKNKTRIELNGVMRQELGFTDTLPMVGERLIITKNNYVRGVINGQQIRITKLNGQSTPLSTSVSYTDEDNYQAYLDHEQKMLNKPVTPSENKTDDSTYEEWLELMGDMLNANPYERTHDFSLRSYKDTGYAVTMDEMREYVQSDYGYAITCHKAQGSEWGKVVVIDDNFGRGEVRQRWLYTAITRASQGLIIAKF